MLRETVLDLRDVARESSIEDVKSRFPRRCPAEKIPAGVVEGVEPEVRG
jgi:hypothetical protein